MPNTNVNIRMDAELKAQADALFADLGLNMSSAVNLFIRQAVRQQGIPFLITRQPTGETLEAMQNALDGKNLSGPYHSISSLAAALEDDAE